jgi:hypothetical protein
MTRVAGQTVEVDAIEIAFPRETLCRLRPAARARDVSVSRLCRDLIEAAATDKVLVDAILPMDDEK